MAAVLASALLAAPIGHVGPAFAADAMEAPAPAAAAEKTSSNGVQNWRYSEFMTAVEEDNVEKATFSADGKRVLVVDVDGNRYKLDALPNDPTLLDTLTKHKVDVTVLPPQQAAAAGGGSLVSSLLFPALLFGGLFLLSQRGQGGEGGGFGGMPGGPGNPMQMGQTQAKVQMQPDTGVTFEDVVGVDGAKIELEEVVQFLKESDRFTELGARIPRGLILEGPPGTGKTLLARAVAGEAGVPFISASGSEFVEMFVGVGASRVRDLFDQAKKNAPCIVFIDEIDAVGRQRSSGGGMGGGNDEREQTLNQILTEMDGFEGNSGAIVVAATNRADILDNALLRPGRFDRRVTVGLPDVKGREQILKVHVANKKLGEDIDLTEVAKRTSGFSGADLENLMNESAILAARRNMEAISNKEVNDATDRVIAGLEGRALADNSAKKLIAYHEAGHALVGTLLPFHDPVNKVTLVPRGQAKGLTWFSPAEDQSLISQNQLRARISGALGGRAAEQIVFGTTQVTSGAGGDLQQVERMARAMVTQFGMSAVGSIAIDDGGMMGPSYSEELAKKIDEAIRTISDECYLTSLKLIMDNRACLDQITEELIEVETMSGDRLREIVGQFTKVPEIATA